MAKTIASALGAVFVLIGLMGFVIPDFLGTHLSLTHTAIHLISGAAALYVGFMGTYLVARRFCVIFGALYFALGVAGFVFGAESTASVAHLASDPRLLVLIPGSLELGTMDHIVHVLLGGVSLVGGFVRRHSAKPALAA